MNFPERLNKLKPGKLRINLSTGYILFIWVFLVGSKVYSQKTADREKPDSVQFKKNNQNSLESTNEFMNPNKRKLRIQSLDSLWQYALAHNPNEAIFKAQIKQAKYNYRASQSVLYPSISTTLTGQDNLHLATTVLPGALIGKPGTSFNAQLGKKYTYNAGILLQKTLLSWQDYMQIMLAEGNYKLSQIQQEGYVQTLKEQVAKLYFSVLVSKMSLEVSFKDKIIADSLVLLSQNKMDKGSIDAITLNLSKINSNTVLQNYAQSKQVFQQSKANLLNILGENERVDLDIIDKIKLDSMGKNISQDLNPDKNLLTYKQQYVVSKIQTKLQKSAFYPQLTFQTYVGLQQFNDNFGILLGNTNWSKYEYLALNLTIPIFTGFYNSAKYKASVYQSHISEIQYQSAQDQGTIQDSLLITNEYNYLAVLKASGENLNLYRKNLELNKQKFEAGLTSLDIYLKAFQDYLNAENNHLNNIAQFLSNRASILARQSN